MEAENGKVLHIIKANYRTIFEINKKRKHYKVEEIDIEQLAREYKNMDENKRIEAVEIIISYNLPLIIAIMRKWYDTLTSEDALQDMMSHLLEVIPGIIDRYNSENKNKFSTYLTSCLRGEAMKFLDTQRVIKYNYYYMVKKKGLEPLKISYESEITDMLEENESALDVYNRYYSAASNELDDVDEERERHIVINKIMEHLFIFIENKVDNDLDKEIAKMYINNYLDTRNNYPVHKIAEHFNVDVNYIYRCLRKIFKEFKKECEDSTNEELNELYIKFIELGGGLV